MGMHTEIANASSADCSTKTNRSWPVFSNADRITLARINPRPVIDFRISGCQREHPIFWHIHQAPSSGLNASKTAVAALTKQRIH